MSRRNCGSSTCIPFSMVLRSRVSAAIAIASLISASVAPFSLANSVWAMMQNLHGICEATARPTSSLFLPATAPSSG